MSWFAAHQGQFRHSARRSPTLVPALALFYPSAVFGAARFAGMPADMTTLVSLLLCLFFSVALYSGRSVTFSGPGRMLAAFTLAMALACLVEHLAGGRSDRNDMWKQYIMAFTPVILFFAFERFARRNDVHESVTRGLYAIGLLAAASIGLEAAGITHFEHYGFRYFGFLSDGSAWLLSLVCVVLFARQKFGLLGLMLVILLLTASRGAMLVTLASLVGLIVTGKGAFRKKMRVNLLAVVAGGLLLAALGSSQLDSFLGRMTGTSVLENDRILTAGLSLDVFHRAPLFGNGFNAQQYFFPQDQLRYYGILGFSTPTSTPMQILADGGLIAFIPFLLFVLALVRVGWGRLRERTASPETALLRGLGAWMICFVLINQFAAWLLPGSYIAPLLFSVAGLVAGASRRIRATQTVPGGFART